MNMQRKLFDKWLEDTFDVQGQSLQFVMREIAWSAWRAAIMENERINAKFDRDGLPPEPKP